MNAMGLRTLFYGRYKWVWIGGILLVLLYMMLMATSISKGNRIELETDTFKKDSIQNVPTKPTPVISHSSQNLAKNASLPKPSTLPVKKKATVPASTPSETTFIGINDIMKPDPSFDLFAIAVKTGKDVAAKRIPIQLFTFMNRVRNKIFIGESPNVYVGDVEIVDVYTNLTDVVHRTENLLEKAILSKRDAEIQADTKSEGWKKDAHKNLPGFGQLWERFPSADWFIMIDDDTYLLLDNLKSALSKYNPADVLFLGVPHRFNNCDGVKKLEQSPLFAHGGTGIIVSRGAMLKMIPGLDHCIKKYHDCWGGDIRVALCLRDAGVGLSYLRGLNGHPPNQDFEFRDPCERPLSFHHIFPNQAQKLYHLEKSMSLSNSTAKHITMADIFADWHGSKNRSIESHTDRKGDNFQSFISHSGESCRQSCLQYQQCLSFTWDGEKCWLKPVIAGSQTKHSFISGIVESRFVCKK